MLDMGRHYSGSVSAFDFLRDSTGSGNVSSGETGMRSSFSVGGNGEGSGLEPGLDCGGLFFLWFPFFNINFPRF